MLISNPFIIRPDRNTHLLGAGAIALLILYLLVVAAYGFHYPRAAPTTSQHAGTTLLRLQAQH